MYHNLFIQFIYTLGCKESLVLKNLEMVSPDKIILTVSIITVLRIRAILLARLPLSRNPMPTAESSLNTLNIKHCVIHEACIVLYQCKANLE